MSALPPEADIRVTHRHVRFGPEPDIPRWHRVHRQRRDRPPIRRVPIDTIETRISLR